MNDFTQKGDVLSMRKLATNISTRRNAEFADYEKWDEPFLDILNRVEVVERLHSRVGTDLAPFLSDLLNQSATTSCKLGADRSSMMVIGDPIYMVDSMRTQANARREEVAKALADANAKMKLVIKQRVKESLDKVHSDEKKETEIEGEHRDKFKDNYTQTLTQKNLKKVKQELTKLEQKYTLLSQEYDKQITNDFRTININN
uniref:Uncharacterized protein n=1 Tax=Cannabis sativa TaxID=3483 RepID=A0A803PH82_CANSA